MGPTPSPRYILAQVRQTSWMSSTAWPEIANRTVKWNGGGGVSNMYDRTENEAADPQESRVSDQGESDMEGWFPMEVDVKQEATRWQRDDDSSEFAKTYQ